VEAINDIRLAAAECCREFGVGLDNFRGYGPAKYLTNKLHSRLRWFVKLAKQLDVRPGDRVFEIGPGPGFFLHIVRSEPYGAVVSGCGKADPIYEYVLRRLGIDTVVTEVVRRGRDVESMADDYSLVVIAGAIWLRRWEEEEIEELVERCMGRLRPGGQLYITMPQGPDRFPKRQIHRRK